MRIIKRDLSRADSTPIIEDTFAAAEWCAIVAAVSRVGETPESFTDARFVHQGRLKLDPPLVPVSASAEEEEMVDSE